MSNASVRFVIVTSPVSNENGESICLETTVDDSSIMFMNCTIRVERDIESTWYTLKRLERLLIASQLIFEIVSDNKSFHVIRCNQTTMFIMNANRVIRWFTFLKMSF